MANWIKCRRYGDGGGNVFVNLDQVVSLSGDDNATVVKYAGHPDAEFVVAGPARKLLENVEVREALPE